jgi:hypothetical protein
MLSKADILDVVARNGGRLRVHRIEWTAMYADAWKTMDDWLLGVFSKGHVGLVNLRRRVGHSPDAHRRLCWQILCEQTCTYPSVATFGWQRVSGGDIAPYFALAGGDGTGAPSPATAPSLTHNEEFDAHQVASRCLVLRAVSLASIRP